MTYQKIILLIYVAYLILMSLVTFALFLKDKGMAQKNHNEVRIKEKTLLSLSVFGGAIGAFLGRIVAQDVLEKVTEYNGKTSKTYTMYMRIETTYRFYNIDKPDEYIDTITYADGLDTGDKASGKAMTYADKYALMKAYKISTGDDPDKEASAEQGYTSVKATPKQIEAVKKLVRDTQAMLDHYNISKIEDLTLEQASEIIAKKGGSNG